MSNFTVEIKATELTQAINGLANALGGAVNANKKADVDLQKAINYSTAQSQLAPTPMVPVQQPAQPTPTTNIPNTQAGVPQANNAPVATVPTATPPTYSMADLQLACAPLMDAGKQQDIANLLTGTFGVQALTQLPKEKYGDFAVALRGLGAKI